MANPSRLSAYSTLPDPLLLFQGKRTDPHPLRGLSNYGPYSAGIGFPGQVRLAYLAPKQFMHKSDSIISELTKSAAPKEALNYYIQYPEFQKAFRTQLIAPNDTLKFVMREECDATASSGDGSALAEMIFQSMATEAAPQTDEA